MIPAWQMKPARALKSARARVAEASSHFVQHWMARHGWLAGWRSRPTRPPLLR